ncbi:MAG TPA: hypothetical protein VNO21_27610, partial [Polyangiaceae bacterium]|nr:hypothetical protein [Polyangiaceae bacterium]
MTAEKSDKSDTSNSEGTLHIYPKSDTRSMSHPGHVRDKDPVRTFMIVDTHGVTVRTGTCFEWEIQKQPENAGSMKVMGEGEAPPAPAVCDWEGLPSDAWESLHPENSIIRVNTGRLAPGTYNIRATREKGEGTETSAASIFNAQKLPPIAFVGLTGGEARPGIVAAPVAVTLGRAHVPPTKDEVLWVAIRASTNQLQFDAYQKFIEGFLSRPPVGKRANGKFKKNESDIPGETSWLISNYGPYRILRYATELFVMTRCGVLPGDSVVIDQDEEEARFGHTLPKTFEEMWTDYLIPVSAEGDEGQALILPYLDIIRRKLGDLSGPRAYAAGIVDEQNGLLQGKLVFPCMVELIWSYWHEEGMLVQAMNAITRRFQNVRAPQGRDPLAQLEIDPLRPLNQLLWGLVQDEPNRLSVLRRAHEYDHHYGFTLHGKVMKDLRTIDRRSKFLESFHNLLHRCTKFYREDDDTTVVADGFPVLNAIKETHYVLAHGAHNQFGDLPATARQEMLVQQYLLARGEMREFLGGRVMVPYPERWMDRVDAVKNLKGWTDVSVVHFRDLATFGEQIVLSIRYGAWSLENTPNSAANWARYWRSEIQGYIHAYRAVTGIDLTSEVTDT